MLVKKVVNHQFVGGFNVFANPTLLVFLDDKEYLRKRKFIAIPEIKTGIRRIDEGRN